MAEKKSKRTRKAACSIFHEDHKVILELEMPGVSKEHLDINIENNLLKVHGSRVKPEVSEKNSTFLIREIADDDYHQEYTLDETIDQERVSASVHQGLVRIELSIKESTLPRKIKIS